MVEVFVPVRTRSQEHGRQREHWARRAQDVRNARTLVWIYLRDYQPPALLCMVTLVRVAPRPLDDDNLRSSCKTLRDQVAIWLGLPTNVKGHAEDRDPRVHFRYQQGKRRPKEYGILVQAESATQAEVDEANRAEMWRP